MDFNAIFKRVIALITDAKNEWSKIKGEPHTVADLMKKYVFVLAAIPAVAIFLGFIIFGGAVSFLFGKYLAFAILVYACNIGTAYIVALVMDAIGPSFSVAKNMNDSFKVVVFSLLPFWIVGVINLILQLRGISYLGLILSLYFLYMGIKIIKTPPAEKEMGYIIIMCLALVITHFILVQITASIVFGYGFGSFFI